MEQLVFNILSYWQVSTGSGEMATWDSQPMLDTDGLPVIPGRQVKGLCRQAVYDAENLGKINKGLTDQLFGTRAQAGQPLLDNPKSAILRFGDARLAKDDRDTIAGCPDLIAQLFHTRRSTAISETGTAEPHSLRFDKVVIPLTLYAKVTPLDGLPTNWKYLIETALPLLNAVGSGRTRGMGRVIVTLEGANL